MFITDNIETKSNRTTIIILFSILIVFMASLSRFARMTTAVVWYDEWLTLQASSLSVLDITNLKYMVFDSHPPMVYLLWKAIRYVAGDNESVMRVVAVIASLLAVWMVYKAASLVTGRVQAVLAAALMLINTEWMWQSAAVRTYPFLDLASTCAFYYTLRLFVLDDNRRTVLSGFCLSVAISSWLHHFGALVLILPVTLYLSRPVRPAHKFYIIGALLIIAPLTVYIATKNMAATQYPHVQMAESLSLGRLLWGVRVMNLREYAIPLATVSAGIVLLGAVLMRTRGGIGVFAASMTVGVFAFGAGQMIHLTTGYFAHLWPWASVLMAHATIWRSRYVWLVILFLAATIVIPMTDFLGGKQWPSQIEYRIAGEKIKDIRKPNDTLVILGWSETPVQWYARSAGISSYDFENRLQTGCGDQRFIFVDGPFARHVTPGNATKIVEHNGVSVATWTC